MQVGCRLHLLLRIARIAGEDEVIRDLKTASSPTRVIEVVAKAEALISRSSSPRFSIARRSRNTAPTAGCEEIPGDPLTQRNEERILLTGRGSFQRVFPL